MNLIKPFNYFQWCTERAMEKSFIQAAFGLELSTSIGKKTIKRKEGRKRKHQQQAQDGAEPFAAE
jgi:hypothetical protein